MKPSPRRRATARASSGFLAVTINLTPPRIGAALADQSSMAFSSAACGITIARMARVVRPVSVTSIASPPGIDACSTCDQSTTSFMSMR
jgi:hypothetical protein